jgi:hypothetical protein
MNVKKFTPLLLIALIVLIYSCKKEIYNIETEPNDSQNQTQIINNLKTNFYQKKYGDKLEEKLNDTIKIVWEPNWQSYKVNILSDSLTYYYIELIPVSFNLKTNVSNHSVKELNIKRFLLIGKSTNKEFFRIANYFFDEKTSNDKKAVRAIGSNYTFDNFSGHVLYENLDINSFNETHYINGAK